MIIKILLLLVLLSIPVLLWGYFTAYLSARNTSLARVDRSFYFGIFSGACAILPLYYFQKYLGVKTQIGNGIFSSYLELSSPASIAQFFGIFVGLLLFLVSIAFIIGLIKNFLGKQSIGWRSYMFFFMLCIVLVPFLISMFLFGLHFMPETIPVFEGESLVVFGVTLTGFSSIFMFYLFSAYLEESVKFFHFLHNYIPDTKKLLSDIFFVVVCVALGFAFFENLLYVFDTYLSSGDFNKAIGVGILRSIFSTTLHISSAIVFARGAGTILSRYTTTSDLFTHWSWKYILVTLSFLLGSLFHAFFNIIIATGAMGLLIFFLVMGYFIITRAFFHPEETASIGSVDDDTKYYDIYAGNPYA